VCTVSLRIKYLTVCGSFSSAPKFTALLHLLVVAWSALQLNCRVGMETDGGAENAGVENAGAITRGNPSEEIP